MPGYAGTLTLAHVYAKALYDVAAEQRRVTETEEEMLALLRLTRMEPAFHRFLESPVLAKEQKRKVICANLQRLSQPLLNFLCLLVDRRRLKLLDEIAEEFHDLANQAQGIAEMELESARALTADEKAQLQVVMEAKTQRKVVIRETAKPELLGGFILKSGDTQWDTSVLSRTQRLVRLLAANREAIGVWRE